MAIDQKAYELLKIETEILTNRRITSEQIEILRKHDRESLLKMYERLNKKLKAEKGYGEKERALLQQIFNEFNLAIASYRESSTKKDSIRKQNLKACLLIFLGILLFSFFLLIVSISPHKKDREAESKTHTYETNTSDGWYFIKDTYIATPSEAKFDKVVEIVASGDKTAYVSYLMQNPDIIRLKKGLKVYLVEMKGWGKVKIRPEGQTIELWTYVEAIR